MRIGELATATGLSNSRIRFYEAKGLIAPARRLANGYRDYPASVVDALMLIQHAQYFGFSLDEIRRVLPTNPTAGMQCNDVLAGLRMKLEEMDAHLARLQLGRQRLLDAIELFGQHRQLTAESTSA